MAAKRLSVCLVCAFLLTGCGELPEGDENPIRHGGGGNHDLRPGSVPAASPGEALDAVASGIQNGDGEGIPEFRRRALLEAARERGSRMGYARRGWEIGGLLERRSSQLDRAFDFSRVAAKVPAGAGYVIPPVVSRGSDAFEGDVQRRKISVVDEYLAIASPGEIRPVRPTWRDYLLFEPTRPDDPGSAPLPRSRAERTRFAEWFGEGWRAGADLADSEITSRLDRLRRDYEGMLRYRRLVSRGMMDRMVLRDADFGVTGGGGEMRVGNRTVRIVSDAAFRADPRRWSVRAQQERDIPVALTNPEISNSSNRRDSTAGDDQVSSSEDLPVSPAQAAAAPTAADDQVPSSADAPASPAQEAAVPPAADDQVSSLEDAPVSTARESAASVAADDLLPSLEGVPASTPREAVVPSSADDQVSPLEHAPGSRSREAAFPSAADDRVSSLEDVPASPSQETAVLTAMDDQVSSLEDMPVSLAQEAEDPTAGDVPTAGDDHASSLMDMLASSLLDAAVPSDEDLQVSSLEHAPASRSREAAVPTAGDVPTAGAVHASSLEVMPASPAREAAVPAAADVQVSSLEHAPASRSREAEVPTAGNVPAAVDDQASSLEDAPASPALEPAIPTAADAGRHSPSPNELSSNLSDGSGS